MRNLRRTTRTFHDEAIIIGSEQDTKSPEYQVRTRVHAHFIHKRTILKLISLRIPLSILTYHFERDVKIIAILIARTDYFIT